MNRRKWGKIYLNKWQRLCNTVKVHWVRTFSIVIRKTTIVFDSWIKWNFRCVRVGTETVLERYKLYRWMEDTRFIVVFLRSLAQMKKEDLEWKKKIYTHTYIYIYYIIYMYMYVYKTSGKNRLWQFHASSLTRHFFFSLTF